MVRLFVSDRILVDGDFCKGGIVASDNGKIEEVFKSRSEVDEWLKVNNDVEVSK